MRGFLMAGLVGFLAAAASGCKDDKAKIPEKTIELPKDGPMVPGGKGVDSQ